MRRRREEATWMTETRNHFPLGDRGAITEHRQCCIRTRAYAKGERSDEERHGFWAGVTFMASVAVTKGSGFGLGLTC